MTKNASSTTEQLRLPDELAELIEDQEGQIAPIAVIYGQGYEEGYAGKVRWPLKSDRAA